VPATIAGTAAAGLGELGTFAVSLVAILILAAAVRLEAHR